MSLISIRLDVILTNLHFSKFQSTINEWRNVFLLGAGVYIIPAIIFILFGSGEVQQWNEQNTRRQNSEEISP